MLTTGWLCLHIALIELDSLSVVLSCVEVHLGLNLKDKVAGVPAEGRRPEVVLLHIDTCVCESNI
jgi:hypothetical protein